MRSAFLPQRLYSGAVDFFAAWVAALGLISPHLIDHAIPWAVPPLHARVIGAFCLGGAVLMFGPLRHPAPRVWAMLPLATIWTGMLLVVPVLWIADFNWAWWTVRFWWFAFVVFPVAGSWLAVHTRPGPIRPAWSLSALALAGLSALLLFAPALAASVWPWPLPPLLSQIYAGPILGLAVGISLAAGRNDPVEKRLLSAGPFTLCAAMLGASLLHLSLFSATTPPHLGLVRSASSCPCQHRAAAHSNQGMT